MQIAAQAANREHGHNIQQHLTGLIGDEQHAASLLKVKTIMEYDTVTEVLRTWEWIRKMSAPKTANGSALEHNFNRS